MISLFPNKKRALGLTEIIIALAIVVAAGIPILRMVTKSRTETSSSVNYLRAMELADEAIEWASVSKFKDVDNLKSLSGTIIEVNGSNIEPVSINTSEVTNEHWKGSEIFEKDLKYSDQYSRAYFYREISVEPITSKNNDFEANLLKKVNVTVRWCEGYMPKNINLASDRNREIQLSILVINDDNLFY
jgi:hypothetical protein